ncbi:hypothetical protein [Mycolicibacterium komossense]|uniref:Uncharacterized protein n=1 Tax=Mycolicibacterium komossense TaxID=1779 RepID=A0ABT3CEF4_9MYCO|nr:hypothetical protein [Mycolicibacterium komossense]MCV7227859.1 hypothetical protein [Mycolicibacterium komossense]
MAQSDKRAKYRHLPPSGDLAETVASVDEGPDPAEDLDTWQAHEGATPYLRTTLGPWVR